MAPASKIENLQKIEDQILAGDSLGAEQSLRKYLKKNKLDTYSKLKVSEFYLWLGVPDRALKILSYAKNLSELDQLSLEDRQLLLRRADLMHFLGANYSANYILEMHGENFFSKGHEFQYWYTLGRLALTRYDYKSAELGFKRALKIDSSHILSTLGLADALEGGGALLEALNLLEGVGLINQPDNKESKLRAILSQMKGEYLVKAGRIEESYQHFVDSENLFGDSDQSKDKAYLYQWWAHGDLFLGNKDRAYDKALLAKNLIYSSGAQPSAVIGISYLLWKLNKASYDDLVRLYLDTTYSPYRECLGWTHRDSPFALHPWIAKMRNDQNYGYILLVPDKSEFSMSINIDELSFDGECFLDLEEGVFTINKKEIKLTDYRIRALRSLIGSGDQGINEFRLWDEVYRTPLWEIEPALDRLKKLVKELKALGFDIKKSKGHYSVSLSKKNMEILVPL